jgi:hypothetical protein
MFSFIGVSSWADARRKERQAYHKSETIKKLAETAGAGGNSAVEYLREEEKVTTRRVREGVKLGGLITAAVGVGLIPFLRMLLPDRPVFMVGVIPMLVGAALLLYGYVLAPQE